MKGFILVVLMLASACISSEKEFLTIERNFSIYGFEYSYRMNYSSNWVIANETEDSEGIFTRLVPSNNATAYFIIFASRPYGDDKRTLSEITEFVVKDICHRVLEIENATLGGLDAHRLKCSRDYTISSVVILDTHAAYDSFFGNVFFRTLYVAQNESFSKYEGEAKSMMDSFEVTW